MKTIGMLGGMSWESTSLYYRLFNEQVKARLGGLHSAKLLLDSVDFAEVEVLQSMGDWPKLAEMMAAKAAALESAGAELLMICTNLMHKVAPQVAEHISVPLVHIGDAVGREIRSKGLTRVGLLGTRYTMEEDFYRARLSERYGLEVIIPDEADRDYIHKTIFTELCRGEFSKETMLSYLEIISELELQGAQGIILGCTEIPLLLRQDDLSLSLFDTAELHVRYALELSFGADAD